MIFDQKLTPPSSFASGISDAKGEGGSLFCTKIVRGGIIALSGPKDLQVRDYT